MLGVTNTDHRKYFGVEFYLAYKWMGGHLCKIFLIFDPYKYNLICVTNIINTFLLCLLVHKCWKIQLLCNKTGIIQKNNIFSVL